MERLILAVNKYERNKKKDNSTKCCIILKVFIIAFLLVLCLVLIFILHSKQKNVDKNAKYGRVNENEQNKINTQFFAVSINSKMYVDKDGKTLAYIKNDKSNKYNMKVKIKEEKSNVVLFSSEVIKSGEQVDLIVIDKKLKPDKYNAIAEFFAVDKNTGEAKGLVIVKIILVVEE